MKLLLDTVTFLWLVGEPARLSHTAREALAVGESYLSAVSAWEIGTKHLLGKLWLPAPPYQYVAHQRERHLVRPLVLDEGSALYSARLPAIHQDPFDRLLIAQALIHGLVLVTPDPKIAEYPVRALW